MAGRGVVAGAAWSSRETERRRSVGTEWKRQKALLEKNSRLSGMGTLRRMSRLGWWACAVGMTRNSVLDTGFPQDKRTRTRDVS